MRRLTPLFLALLLLLTGCGQSSPAPDEPTESSVERAYLSAEEVYGWFNMTSLPVGSAAVKEDGWTWYPVEQDGIATYVQLEAKVRSLFSAPLADSILKDAPYRDIGGRLYATNAARGSNIYQKDRSVSVSQAGDSRWTVTLTFWADSWAWECPSVTIGFSKTKLDYEKTEDGWRFTSFCPSDDLDTDAATVFHFTYTDDAFASADCESFSDLQLALYLIHADGAYMEYPIDEMTRRFSSRPDEILALAPQMNVEWQGILFPAVGFHGPVLDQSDRAAFQAALDSASPKNDAEKSALEQIRQSALQDSASAS